MSAAPPGRRRDRYVAATSTLAGAALLITLVTVLSRVIGFGRSMVQAHEVGVLGVGDAYATANLLPNVLFEVAAGGALAGAVVPVLAGAVARAARTDVDRSASALLGWALLVLVPLGALVAALARPLVELLPVVGDGAEADVATYFLRVFAVQVPLYGVAVVLAGVLQAHKRFFWPAFTPVLSSGVVIVAYLVFGALAGDPARTAAVPHSALAWLAWGTTAGVAALALPLLVPVRRAGVHLRPTLRFPPGQARRARGLALAGVGAVAAQQLATVAVLVASSAWGGPGAFPRYQLAYAVYVLPYAVLAVPLATSAFPRLAERAATGDRDGFARLTAGTTRAVVTVVAAGAAALIASADAVQAFYATFAHGPVQGMAALLAWLAPGLVGLALIFHLSRALYALDDGRAAVLAVSLGWAVVTLGVLVLPPLLVRGPDDAVRTLEGIGAATSLGLGVAGAALLAAVRRRSGAHALDGVVRTGAVVTVGAVVGAVVGRLLVAGLLGAAAGTARSVAVGVLAGLVAAAVVLGGSRALDAGAWAALRGGRRG